VTLAAPVRAAAERFGPRTALVDPDGSRLSYAELDVRSDEVAAGLRHAGVGPGDVVLLRLPSDSTYVVAYAAAAKVGAVTAGVNPRLAAPEQDAVATVAGAGRTIASAPQVDDLAPPGVVEPRPDDPERPGALGLT
jgi:acyl-CoA synthetase (AMP-forming)/AMP-acid ligase II